MRRRAGTIALWALLAGCRGTAPGTSTAQVVVDSLRPMVERAAGLRFRRPPRVVMRSPAQVRAYLQAKFDAELPESRAAGMEAAYRLFGLLPDSVRLRPLLVDLLSEQVAGYYDADSAMLFAVTGSPREQLRLVMAHEMVHALQDEYLPLDSILHDLRNSDRVAAAQAIIEGQATFASFRVYDTTSVGARGDEFWAGYPDAVYGKQAATPVFARAPLIIREGLLFPYVAGAEFMHWWSEKSGRGDTVPYGPRMPASTEQVLHPDRYAAGDVPLAVAIDSMPGTIYTNVLGEVETTVLIASALGLARPDELPAVGWGGDRYVVTGSPAEPALVWYIVFDDVAARDRFLRTMLPAFSVTRRAGYRTAAVALGVDGRPAVRYVLAPASWGRWATPPAARIDALPPAPRSAP